jgi:cytochrome c2
VKEFRNQKDNSVYICPRILKYSKPQNYEMAHKLKKVAILIVVILLSNVSNSLSAQDAKAGKATFRSKCGSCHAVDLKQKMTGPALEGVIDRWKAAGDFKGKTGEQWLRSWITNWNDPVAAGMPYAVKMQSYDASAMTVFAGQISDEELNNILAYIANPAAAAPAGTTVSTTMAVADTESKSSYSTSIIIALILLLVLVYLLGRASKSLAGMSINKSGDKQYTLELAEEDKTPFYLKSSFKSGLMLITTLLFVFALGKSAMNLGRQQGYQPTQPIRYSHELHAGKNKIECQYCHFTAADGKHANIPSVSTCMNCHKAVQQGPKYGKSEIAKIYEAVGWDPNTSTYSKQPKPVEWVRIHNLPDHVYFNHAQHVTAGKVECQTCHGPIEKMEEVYQYSPLSMGWCINCHRNHDVQFVDNAYYKTFAKFHEEIKNGTRKRVTVSDIGGTECQKCHY